MHIVNLLIAIIGVISFVLARKAQETIVSDSSPFSFADDILIIKTGSIFSIKSSNIECIELQYNQKINKKTYAMRIHILKTDGSIKNIRYRGSSSGVCPQDMATALTSHCIQCDVKD